MSEVKNKIRFIGRFIILHIPFIKKVLPVKLKVKFGIKLSADEFKEYTLHGIFPSLYTVEAKKPIDENKVVFIVVRHTRLTSTFHLIYDRLMQNYCFDIHIHFLRNPFASRSESIIRSREMIKDVATAKYVFIDDGCAALSCLPMRSETKVVQLWHGCGAFKKFGMSTAELIFGSSREEQLRFPNHANYTYSPVSSSEVVWAYEEAFNLKKNSGIVIPTGCSRTDIFYDKDFIDNARKKLHRLMPESKGKKVILYAPTFRGRVKNAAAPNMLNLEKFYNELSDEYVFIFKHHPLVKKAPGIAASYSHFASDLTDAMSIEELLCVADICISDYSSLIFEFSLFEKPMIFYAYDLDEYFDWRGFYYDYNELTPGPVFKSNDDIIEYIKNIDSRFDVKTVRLFRQKFMSSCDGHATQRILDTVFGDALASHEKTKNEKNSFSYHHIPCSKPLTSEKNKTTVCPVDTDSIKDAKIVYTDIFYDEKRKESILNEIHKSFVHSVNKKIICWLPEIRTENVLRPKKAAYPDLREMYEKLKDEYVIICFIPQSATKKFPEIKYFGEFICNAEPSVFNPYEIMSVSDIVIGDYKPEVLDFLLTGKMLLFYAPDAAAQNTFSDYFELTHTIRFNSTDSLIKQINSPESYNYAHIQSLQKHFSSVCDGNSSNYIPNNTKRSAI